jgi:sulfate permease, SulP family
MNTPTGEHIAVPAAAAPSAAGQFLAGSVGSIASLAIVLTIGLLAYAPLGAIAPEVGIPAAFNTAVLGGLVMALLGRSALPTGGPSSATALIFAALVAQLMVDPQLNLAHPRDVALLIALASVAVLTMGALLIVFGLLRLGSMAQYVPQPVLAGFMNGVAILILLAQLPMLAGVSRADWQRNGLAAFSHVQPATLALGLLTAVVVWVVARRWPRAPATLIALIAGSAAFLLVRQGLPAVPLGPQTGSLLVSVPRPEALLPLAGPSLFTLLLPHLDDVLLTGLLLALIGALESVLSARAVDQVLDTQHDPNRELIALGSANLVSAAIGGIPLVYLRARAQATIVAGGRSKVAAVGGCIALGAAFFAGGGLLAWLPLTVLAGVMVTVAFSMMDRWTRQLLRQWLRGERTHEAQQSIAVVAIVCTVTLILGLVAGVALGMVLSMAGFARSMNRTLVRGLYSGAQRPSRRVYPPAQEAVLQSVRGRIVVLELEGALFFGSAQRLASEVDQLQPTPAHLILDLKRVTTIDATGSLVLERLSQRLAANGSALTLAAVTSRNRHGQALTSHGAFAGAQRGDWAVDVDRALEHAERALLVQAGCPLEHATLPLAQCPLFAGLDDMQQARLEALLTRVTLEPGERLFAQGDPGDALYLLTEGSISVVGGGAAGDDTVRQRFLSFSPGMTFGELALLDGAGRSADAIADTKALLYELSREALVSLDTADPALAARLYRNLAHHLAQRLRNAAAAWQGDAM